MATIDEALAIATGHHRAGRLADAEALYRQILNVDPNHTDSLHLLGLVAHQAGRNDIALEFISRAIALKSEKSHYHNNISIVLMQLNRPADAVAAARRAVELKPDYFDAYINLSHALSALNQHDQAEKACRKAIELQPNQHQAYINLACVLGQLGRMDESLEAHHRAVELAPDNAVAHCNLGAAYHAREQFDDAIASYQRAIEINPQFAEVHSNLGNALKDKNQLEAAIASYRKAIASRFEYAEGHCNLGTALQMNGQSDEAMDCFRRAMKLRPDLPEAHQGMGTVLYKSGKYQEAIDFFRSAIALRDEFPNAHWNLALALLITGQFEEGWKQYEWRWSRKKLRKSIRDFDQPLWEGGDLDGKTILVYCEQGFGDAIQFCRYLPLLQQRGAKVMLECPRELVQMMEGALDLERVVPAGEPLGDFDTHIALMSLPYVFRTTLETIPATIPYLHADPARVEYWKTRLNEGKNFKIGIAWAGRSTHPNDRNRSVPLETFLPLAALANVRLYSLQKSEAAWAQARASGLDLIDYTNDLHDFADTAALIANLDLVIAVDTAVVHLAGALGKDVWTLLPFVPDWRWMLERPDSPWYPTMHLFRQPAPGDWESVREMVANALRERIHV